MNHGKTRVWSQSGTGESRKVNRLYRRAQGGQTHRKKDACGLGVWEPIVLPVCALVSPHSRERGP